MTRRELPHLNGSRVFLPLFVLVTAGCGLLQGDDVRPSRCEPELSGGANADTSERPFEKPDEHATWEDPRGKLELEDLQDEEHASGAGSARTQIRDFAAPNPSRDEAWLDPGEPLVVDMAEWWDATFEEARDLRTTKVMVFVDYRPVRFDLVRVDGVPNSESFPSVDELRRRQESQRVHMLEAPKGERTAYTVYLPAESFGGRGAHDVRIVQFLADAGVYPGGAGPSPHITVNYGGTDFVAIEDVESRRPSLQIPPEAVRDRLRSEETLLVPPSVEPANLQQTDLDRVFPVSGPSTTLDAWIQGDCCVDEVPLITLAILDGELVDGSRSLLRLPHAPRDISRQIRGEPPRQPYAARMQVDVPLEKWREQSVQLFAFASPNCRAPGPDGFRRAELTLKRLAD